MEHTEVGSNTPEPPIDETNHPSQTTDPQVFDSLEEMAAALGVEDTPAPTEEPADDAEPEAEPAEGDVDFTLDDPESIATDDVEDGTPNLVRDEILTALPDELKQVYQAQAKGFANLVESSQVVKKLTSLLDVPDAATQWFVEQFEQRHGRKPFDVPVEESDSILDDGELDAIAKSMGFESRAEAKEFVQDQRKAREESRKAQERRQFVADSSVAEYAKTVGSKFGWNVTAEQLFEARSNYPGLTLMEGLKRTYPDDYAKAYAAKAGKSVSKKTSSVDDMPGAVKTPRGNMDAVQSAVKRGDIHGIMTEVEKFIS
jgi:hypothetical protein